MFTHLAIRVRKKHLPESFKIKAGSSETRRDFYPQDLCSVEQTLPSPVQVPGDAGTRDGQGMCAARQTRQGLHEEAAGPKRSLTPARGASFAYTG